MKMYTYPLHHATIEGHTLIRAGHQLERHLHLTPGGHVRSSTADPLL